MVLLYHLQLESSAFLFSGKLHSQLELSRWPRWRDELQRAWTCTLELQRVGLVLSTFYFLLLHFGTSMTFHYEVLARVEFASTKETQIGRASTDYNRLAKMDIVSLEGMWIRVGD